MAYLDHRIGRSELVGLLRATTNDDLLALVGATDRSLLADWLASLNGN